jgi:hypothetical protein
MDGQCLLSEHCIPRRRAPARIVHDMGSLAMTRSLAERRSSLDRCGEFRRASPHRARSQIFTKRELARALHSVVNGVWRLLRAILLISWLNLVFTQFPWSQDLAVNIIGFVFA